MTNKLYYYTAFVFSFGILGFLWSLYNTNNLKFGRSKLSYFPISNWFTANQTPIFVYNNIPYYDTNYHIYKDFLKQLINFKQTKYLSNRTKQIVVYGYHKPELRDNFTNCFISNCKLSFDRNKWQTADALIITDSRIPNPPRIKKQIWILYLHESPYHSYINNVLGSNINFTATYRKDSTIPLPYGEYIPLNPNDNYQTTYPLPKLDYSKNKTKMVAWFVSNCNAPSPRLAYTKKLSNYIQVHIFGSCGNKHCSRNGNCFEMLRNDYRFYLSFENSLCRDYVTEKFFQNALTNNIIPIVMGASLDEVTKLAPRHSFIHVDQFESPAKLAAYLHYLSSNRTAYNEYFAWHHHGTVEVWKKQTQCDICALTHMSQHLAPSWYSNAPAWWNDGCADRTVNG